MQFSGRGDIVSLSSGQRFQLVLSEPIVPEVFERVAIGTRLPVLADPRSPTRVFVDWASFPAAQGLGRAAAEEGAAPMWSWR